MFDIDKVYKELSENIEENKILLNEPMSKHTSFKIGGVADILVKADAIEEIKHTIVSAKNNNTPIFVLGNGSNLLVKEEGVRGIVLNIKLKNLDIDKRGEEVIVTAGSGIKLIELAMKLQKEGITGLEFASRNTRNHWRSNSNECRCLWWRDEGYCY